MRLLPIGLVPRPVLRAARSALVSLAGISSSALAEPVITEVAWMGSDTDANDEWVEIYNPDVQAITLSAYVLVGGASGTPGLLALPSVSVEAGGTLVVQRRATVPLDSTVVSTPPTSALASQMSLVNSDEVLCLCPANATACDAATCDVANLSGAWPAGSNTVPKKTMERIGPALDGSFPDGALDTSWQDGNPSSPGEPTPPPALVDAGPEPGDDAGPVSDAGPEPGVDAGPNATPTVVVTEPSAPTSAPVVGVVYSTSDPDGDAVSVDLFWSLDPTSRTGTRFAQGLPGGTSQTASFDTAGVPPGIVYVFAAARDARGEIGYGAAPGSISVQGGAPAVAQFKLTDPDGVNDVDDEGVAQITWDLTLPAGASGTIALFLDDDDAGEGGAPLAGGLAAGPDAARAFKLPLAGLEPGEHHVYGVLDYATAEGSGRIVSYAPASLTIPGEGCGCTTGGSSPGRSLPAVATLAILLLAFVRSSTTRGAPSRR